MKANPRIYLAPIQGVTNDIYRNAYHMFFSGVDKYFAPFVKVQLKGDLKRKKTKGLLPAWNEQIPLVPQILSNEGEEFLVFDAYVRDLGYSEFNWNLGCPVAMVTVKKRGSGLLPHAERIQAILEKVLGKLKCRLSIKTRLGLVRPEELLNLIPVFNQFPIHELIIHPRLGRQMYGGQVDLQTFGECLKLSKIPVVYNGDVFNAAAFEALQIKFPQVQSWMLGRGVLVNPFLPAQIKGLDVPNPDKAERFKLFHDECVRRYETVLSGPGHVMDKLKEFWFYSHRLFENGTGFFNRLKKVKAYAAYHGTVNSFFAHAPKAINHLRLVSEDF